MSRCPNLRSESAISIVAACLCALSGCSSYEVYDAYTSHETGKQYISFDGEGGNASISFARDDPRFVSMVSSALLSFP